jgi:hypothetical protein
MQYPRLPVLVAADRWEAERRSGSWLARPSDAAKMDSTSATAAA